MTLTASNSIVALVTLPLLNNFAISVLLSDEEGLGIQLSKAVEVFLIVLVPVLAGMLVRCLWPKFADRMDKPVPIASMINGKRSRARSRSASTTPPWRS